MYLNIIIDKEIDSVDILNKLSKSNFDDIKKQAENKITLINNEIEGLLSNIIGNEERLIELLVIKNDFDKIADLASDSKSGSDLLEAIFMNEDSGDDAWAAITINPNRIIPDDIYFFNDLENDSKKIQLNNPTFPLTLLEHIVENIDGYENAKELLKLITQHPNANDDLMMKLHETQFAEIRLEVCNIVNNRNNSNLTSALDEIREKTEIKFEGPVVEFYGGEYIKDDGSYEKGWERIIEWNIGYKIVKVVSMEDEIELLNKLIEQENINLYDYEYVSHKYSTGYDTLYDADGNEVDFDDDGCEYEEDNYSENEDTIEEKCIILASSYSFKINEE